MSVYISIDKGNREKIWQKEIQKLVWESEVKPISLEAAHEAVCTKRRRQLYEAGVGI